MEYYLKTFRNYVHIKKEGLLHSIDALEQAQDELLEILQNLKTVDRPAAPS